MIRKGKESTELKSLFRQMLTDLGVTDLNTIFKGNNVKKRKDFIKKIKNPSITWKTFIAGIPLLDISDVKLHVEACFPKSKDTYHPPVKCFVPLSTEATEDGEARKTKSGSTLGPNELRVLLELLLRGSGINQVTYNNRVLTALTDAYPNISPHEAKTKLSGILKRIKADGVSWRTFHEAVVIAGAVNIVLSISFTRDGKNYLSKVDVKCEDGDDIFS